MPDALHPFAERPPRHDQQHGLGEKDRRPFAGMPGHGSEKEWRRGKGGHRKRIGILQFLQSLLLSLRSEGFFGRPGSDLPGLPMLVGLDARDVACRTGRRTCGVRVIWDYDWEYAHSPLPPMATSAVRTLRMASSSRVLIVPSGMPVSAAISRWLSPR